MSTSIPPQDGFIPVLSRKKKRKGAVRAVQRVSFTARLQRVTADIVGTEWIKGCQKKMEISLENLGWDPPDILCLGLGSPMESDNAAAQLALVISICDSLKITHDCVSFFDPHFAQEDIDGLIEMRFRVLSENKARALRGKHALQRRTLLMMPHCGVELYENVLRENWDVEGLRHLLLLGNVLEDYATTTPVAKLEQEAPCVSRIWKHLACDPFSSFEVFPCAFNNLGLQYVRMDSLPQREDGMWTLPLPIAGKASSAEIF